MRAVPLQVPKQVQKDSFIRYILSNQVWWVIPKITSANSCKSIHDIINYSTSICLFESGKCGKEGKKLQKFEYLENKKSFVDEIKNIFHRAIILWKNKNLIKNSTQALRIIKKDQYALWDFDSKKWSSSVNYLRVFQWKFRYIQAHILVKKHVRNSENKISCWVKKPENKMVVLTLKRLQSGSRTWL